MRRVSLSSPRPIRGELAQARTASRVGRRRSPFDPRRGWLRRFERRASRWLARDVFPRVPWMHVPYDRQLRRRLTLSEADIALDGLPSGFDGTRILFISDLHAGPFVSPVALRETFERLLVVQPDVVLLGGDLTTTHALEFVSHRGAFAALRAPLGVYTVLGNHDHYSREGARLRGLVEEVGITVLHNRSIALRRGGDRLDLAGVDDLLLGETDLGAALEGTRPPVVLLSHNPDLFFDAARSGVALMLSGHTHGGQIRIPGLRVIVWQSRYRFDEGRFKSGGTELIISRGLGTVRLPWRTACSPEALLIRLRSSA